MDNNKKLFVGGLNYSTTDDTLRDFFAGAGTVESATVIIDRMSGRSKGFGFVEMATEEEANAAIEQMNGKELDGRTISVNIARPKVDRPSFGGGAGGNRGGGGYNRR